MSDAALALQRTIFSALSNHANLAALVGTRIYDGPPRNAATPYVHLGETAARDWSTGTEPGAEIRLAVVIVSREAGRSEALAIAARITALLHEAALAPEGWRLVNLRHLATESGRSVRGDIRRATLRFRAVIEPGT